MIAGPLKTYRDRPAGHLNDTSSGTPSFLCGLSPLSQASLITSSWEYYLLMSYFFAEFREWGQQNPTSFGKVYPQPTRVRLITSS